MLHDIGRVALFNADPSQYTRVLQLAAEKSVNLIGMEREILKYDHQEIGAVVMQHWNLPEIFVDTVREHGILNIQSPHRNIIRKITIADILTNQMGYGELADHDISILDDLIENSALNDDDMTYFREEYASVMEADPLFEECEKLFFDGKE